MPSINNLAITTALNITTNGVKGKIPNFTNLAITTVTAAEKTPNVSNLVKKN